MQKKRKMASGANRMAQLGKIPVQIWFTAEQHEKLFRLSEREAVPMATLVRSMVLHQLRAVDV